MPRWWCVVGCRQRTTNLATIGSQTAVVVVVVVVVVIVALQARYLVSTMLSRIAQQAVKRALPVRPVAFAPFSTELIPGVGMGKTSTGIVGLPVDLDAVSNIVVKYQGLLDRMAASDMPETAQYRSDVEKISRYRIKIAMENPEDPEMVEDLCQCGQVEELVQQADDEMEVLEMYLKERMWELVDSEVDIEYNPDPSQDHDGIEDDE